MNTKRIHTVTVLVLAAVFAVLSIWSWFKPVDEYSDTERRHLALLPKLSLSKIWNGGSFMTDFEAYATDQFPLRETFRTANALVQKYVLGQQLVNDIYVEEGYAVKPEITLDRDSLDWALQQFSAIHDRYLSNSQVYVAVIPDKGYYLSAPNGYPAMDYAAMLETVRAETSAYAQYIDLTEHLSAENYYRTDTHWKQETLADLAAHIASSMSAEAYDAYEQANITDSFYGVYYGQAALPMDAEQLSCLTNDTLAQLQVSCWDSGKAEPMPLYDLQKATGKDGYEMYLGGALALITMDNPNAETNRELVIFRDSFGSSLAPLLTQSYRRVTLVDTRYLSPAFLGKFVNFERADVLFLYSTLILNSAKGQLLPFSNT